MAKARRSMHVLLIDKKHTEAMDKLWNQKYAPKAREIQEALFGETTSSLAQELLSAENPVVADLRAAYGGGAQPNAIDRFCDAVTRRMGA